MGYFVDILELLGIFVLLTISLNFLVGNVGIFSLGHVGFFAIGAYSTAILSHYFSSNPLPGLLGGVCLSAGIALLLGAVTLRLSGHYLLIVSLGFCEIVRSIANNLAVTGGASGMVVNTNYPAPALIFFFLLLQLLFFHRLLKSPRGRLFYGVRDDSVLLTVLGKRANRLKLQAFIISGAWASIAGSLYAGYAKYIDPTSFTVQQSLLLFIGILVGGLADIRGSLLAAFILIAVPVLIRFIHLPATVISPMHQVVFALFVLFILKYKPEGLFGKIQLR
jgi:branched-chain amino acid transport system permease protein